MASSNALSRSTTQASPSKRSLSVVFARLYRKLYVTFVIALIEEGNIANFAFCVQDECLSFFMGSDDMKTVFQDKTVLDIGTYNMIIVVFLVLEVPIFL